MRQNYESPIQKICGDIESKVVKQEENMIFQEIRNIGINVDKQELIKALQYDREQYEKGYADAKKEIGEELIKRIEGAIDIDYVPYTGGYTTKTLKADEVIRIIEEYCEV